MKGVSERFREKNRGSLPQIRPWLLLLLATVWGSVLGQDFQAFLNRVNSLPPDQRGAVVDSFMATVPAFPFIEGDSLVHFIYRGAATSVSVPGDFNGWNASAWPMTNLFGTNFWYRTTTFEDDARLDYKFVLNGNNWILDPRNPHQVLGGFGPNSELRMPEYVPPPEVNFQPGIPHGTFKDTVFFSTHLGNSRLVRVYLPPGYATTTRRYPVLLVHDGLDYINLAAANNILDYLIFHQRIEPIMAVFVPPVNRNQEYAGSLMGAFTSFIVQELMPWVDGRFRTETDPDRRAVMGASNGGNISLWLALTHPEVFGNVAAQSSNVIASVSSGFQNKPQLDLRIYLDLGTYDIPVLIPLVRNLVGILQSKNYALRYQEFHEGHSWGNWRAHIDDALEFFFPALPTALPTPTQPASAPEGFLLFPNYPNPFNPITNITFRLSRSARVTLDVFDAQGERVRRLLEGRRGPGTYRLQWDGTGQDGRPVASGIYIYRLTADQARASGKMLLVR
ncbi:MAG: T9SS C-terminal target domain-containing protein [Calditrichaeota bacterium]|nr:MAG: T9SS C-terminal target domain-containing protein [Calditrichota bacterium]